MPPITGIRLTAPTWDSNKNVPSFSDFSTQFESFVDYQTEGGQLIALINHVLGRKPVLVSLKVDVTLDAAISFSPADQALLATGASLAPDEVADEEVEDTTPDITSYRDLSKEAIALDHSLHNILDNSVTGAKRSATCRQKAKIQAVHSKRNTPTLPSGIRGHERICGCVSRQPSLDAHLL